jgi:hypothetical protein
VLPRFRERALRAPSSFATATLLAGLCAGLAVGGCKKNADVKAEAEALQKAFPAAATVPAAGPGDASAGQQATAGEASALVNSALSSVQKQDYAGGVIALQQVAEKPGVTPEQLMNVEQTKQAIIADLVRRADAGDASAKTALKAIERSRSQ